MLKSFPDRLMPDKFSRRILKHVADRRYTPRLLRDLANDLGVPPDELDAFRDSATQLIHAGQIVLASSHAITLPPPGRKMIGTFRLNPRGFGFVVPDSPVEHGDLFIPAGNTGGAMTGDHVRADVIHAAGRGRDRSPYIGRIVEILSRSDKRYTGNLARQGSLFLVYVDGKSFTQPVVIRDPHAKNAKPGDKVVIEITEYPEGDALPQGVITEVLGAHGQPDVETAAVMRAYNLPDQFPPQVLQQARNASQSFRGTIASGRLDLTRDFIITIDPPDARDFDDAISLKSLDPASTGGAVFELGVHIADVAHFVAADSPLDVEARLRGNSVYLPRRVIPMLPETLSNGVCSLQEGVVRFCKSAFIRYDQDANVLSTRFARTAIKSAKRLTYREAQALIDGDPLEARKHARTDTPYTDRLVSVLKQMNDLAVRIRQRRLRAGMIVLALPEVELIFDDDGRVIDAQPEDNSFTHTLIEMFMVEANEAAARLFNSLNVPMIRRIHDEPPSHDLSELKQFARVAGFNVPSHPSRYELQKLLDAVRGRPAQHAVHLAVLQTLSKAEYACVNIGHFALASEHYTHFTSPIRRYPDFIVHRALDAYLDAHVDHAQRLLPGGKKTAQLSGALVDDPRIPDEDTLAEIASHCSATERNAEAAERDLRTYLVLELLAQHLGELFDGTVTGMTNSGVFIQLNRYLVDGYVRLEDLPGKDENWRMNRTTGALVAQRSGRTISIGDRFTVRLVKVSPESRQLDLQITSDTPGRAPALSAKKDKRRQPPGARKAHQQTMNLKRSEKRKRRHR